MSQTLEFLKLLLRLEFLKLFLSLPVEGGSVGSGIGQTSSTVVYK